MPTVPAVDLTGGAGAPRQAERLEQACRHVGMFEIVGHGVPDALFDDLFGVTREFFALPSADKARVAQPQPDQVRGWSPVGSEGIAYSLDEESPADLKEKFDMGPVIPTGTTGPHHAPNLWPDRPETLRAVWETYYAHLTRIGEALMGLFAVAVGLPADWLAPQTAGSVSMLRALHYPDQAEPPLVGQSRAGAHSDYGAFTVMSAEERPGGLEILDRGGEWTPVSTTPGRLLAVPGDLIAEWTGDRWPATLHRVVNPPRAAALSSSRLAFAFYQHPDPDAHVDLLPPFHTDAEREDALPLTAGEHLRHKYLRQTTFGRRGA